MPLYESQVKEQTRKIEFHERKSELEHVKTKLCPKTLKFLTFDFV